MLRRHLSAERSSRSRKGRFIFSSPPPILNHDRLNESSDRIKKRKPLSCTDLKTPKMNAIPIVTLDQLAGISIEEFLSRVLQEGTLTVQFPDGEAVTIQPKPKLQSLPVLEGYVPKG